MITATTIELTTWSTERNPTLCEVTKNTWWTCERSWCQCMSLHALKILRFRSLSFLLSVGVVVLWLSSLIDARTLSSSSRLKFESSFTPSSRPCFMRVLSAVPDLFDTSIHFITYLFISLIFLLFLLLYTFYFLDVVDNKPAHFRWGATGHELNVEHAQIRTLLDRQSEQILADCQAEIRKHEFQADYDRRSIQKLKEVIESQRGEIYRAHQGDEQHRRDQQLLHEQLLEQNRNLREAHMNSLNKMEELKPFQGATFDTISRRKLIEYRDTILVLTGKVQELQNEINWMNNSRDFQDAESVRIGQSHVTSQAVSFPLYPVPGGMLSRFRGNAEPQRWAAKNWGHAGYIGKRFCKSTGVFFITLSRRIQSLDF